MADGLRIEPLSDHLDLVPLVADWCWQQWGEDTVSSQVSWTATVAGRLRTDEVPFSLVALLDGEPVGAVSVCWDDADLDVDADGPWLSGMVVRGPARNLGIGRQLLAEAGDRAAALGHPALWAHTAEAERFYERCGWEVIRPKEPLRRDAVVRHALEHSAEGSQG